jgi:hypothetical protein
MMHRRGRDFHRLHPASISENNDKYLMETELAAPTRPSANRQAFSVPRPALYVFIVLGFVLAAYAYKLRTDGIFACWADGYASDQYLAYCHAKGYGDYEHGAFWFGLEPSTRGAVSGAEVLFLGSSRMQIALSTAATNRWFSSDHVKYFLLGFGYNGNVLFEGELLRKFGTHARAYVISVDGFFNPQESQPVKAVMHDASAWNHYEVKHLWQLAHETLCQGLPALCGKRYTIFRSRETGAYRLSGLGEFQSHPVSYDEKVDPAAAEREAAEGKAFLSKLPVGADCVILTVIPTDETSLGTANAIAKAIGQPLVNPEIAKLQTFDGSHLDPQSAERWSEAFLKAAGPQIRRCLGKR